MKDITLYAYSQDKEFLDWTHFLLSKVKTNITVCSDSKELEFLLNNLIPDILLLDDHSDSESACPTILEIIERGVPRKRRGASMVIVLSAHASDVEYKVDYLLNGADYIIEKPVNMVELVARIIAIIRHQRFVQQHIINYIAQTSDITRFDVKDTVMEYLNNHIKPIIQNQIDAQITEHSTGEEKDIFLKQVNIDNIKIMAALSAIKDDVYEHITAGKEMHKDEHEHLDELFKKNLRLVDIAYNGSKSILGEEYT